MRDHALVVNGGTVTAADASGRAFKDLWELTLEPAGTGPVSILTPLERACTETGALCTADGQVMLDGCSRTACRWPVPAAQGQQAQAALGASRGGVHVRTGGA